MFPWGPCSKHWSAAPLPPLHSSLLTPPPPLWTPDAPPPPPAPIGFICFQCHPDNPDTVYSLLRKCGLFISHPLESSFCFCAQACCISPTCHRCTCLLSFPAQTRQPCAVCSPSSAVLRALLHLSSHTPPGWVIVFHCKHPPVFLALRLEQVTSLALEEQEMFLFVPGWHHMTLF